VGWIKGYSQNIYSKKRAGQPNQTKGKRQPARENTTDMKELLTLAPGDVCRWEKLKSMKMMMSENQSSNHKFM
jgi:hypothetical protein